jgi:hypothetical protein
VTLLAQSSVVINCRQPTGLTRPFFLLFLV